MSEIPWPPWLEKLGTDEKVWAIIEAVIACCDAPSGPGHEDGKQHCTPSMADVFLLKLIREEADTHRSHPR